MPRMVQSLPSDNLIPGAKAFAERALLNLLTAHDTIIDSRIHQTHHANRRCRDEDIQGDAIEPLKPGDKVCLSRENFNLPKSRAHKLTPRFIGPYLVIDGDSSISLYTLDLSSDLKNRGIHSKFHVNLLRQHYANDDLSFPHRETRVYYDLGEADDKEWLVDELLGRPR